MRHVLSKHHMLDISSERLPDASQSCRCGLVSSTSELVLRSHGSFCLLKTFRTKQKCDFSVSLCSLWQLHISWCAEGSRPICVCLPIDCLTYLLWLWLILLCEGVVSSYEPLWTHVPLPSATSLFVLDYVISYLDLNLVTRLCTEGIKFKVLQSHQHVPLPSAGFCILYLWSPAFPWHMWLTCLCRSTYIWSC